MNSSWQLVASSLGYREFLVWPDASYQMLATKILGRIF